MQHEPRPATDMELQLGWAHNLGGAESLGIFKAVQTVLARLMEFQIRHQPSGVGLGKGTVAFARPDARHFSSSLHTTGGTPALPHW